MQKLLPALALYLLSSPLFAAAKEVDASAPVETVDVVWVMIFVALFVSSIVGFLAFVWIRDRKSGDSQSSK
jgi:hypothetical protein